MDLDILESMKECDDDSYQALSPITIDYVRHELELKIAKVEQRLQIIKGNNTALFGEVADVKNIIGLMWLFNCVVFSVLYYIK